MQLIIQMHLESDAIFGNGVSIPGGEDIGIQTDTNGFPYMKGSTNGTVLGWRTRK